MFTSFLNKLQPKSKYSIIPIKQLINNYFIPKCQRSLDNDRLKILDINLTKYFNPIVPLYFCVYKNKRYIIDGQHRLNCYKNN